MFELVRMRHKKTIGQDIDLTLLRVASFLEDLQKHPTLKGVFVVNQIANIGPLLLLFKDLTRILRMGSLTRHSLLHFNIGEYRIRFVSKANTRALKSSRPLIIGRDFEIRKDPTA